MSSSPTEKNEETHHEQENDCGSTGMPACTAGLSACSLTGTGDTHHIAVIIKHAGEHFQNVMAGAEACASEHPNVTIDIQFPSFGGRQRGTAGSVPVRA